MFDPTDQSSSPGPGPRCGCGAGAELGPAQGDAGAEPPAARRGHWAIGPFNSWSLKLQGADSWGGVPPDSTVGAIGLDL